MKKILAFFLLLAVAATGCGPAKPSLEDFQRSVGQINEKQKEIFEKSQDVSKSIREVSQKYPDKKITFDTSLGLTREQEDVMLGLIKEEKDPTFKGVLQKVVDDQKEIGDLKKQVDEIQSKLPAPYVVKRGDTHAKIAIEYLMNTQGLTKEEARKKVLEVALADDVVSGYNIWLYYNKDGDIFGTFVTQGTSKINPNRLRYSRQRDRIQRAVEEALGEREAAPVTPDAPVAPTAPADTTQK
ncbi:MAG: hypothetical protein IAF08_01935 [Rhizobacter sp.]|nr:hypothetical protein [Chlorobiales bacterium]